MMNKQTIFPELTITGLGLSTSVGHDHRTACASIRAGLKRTVTLSHYAPRLKNGIHPDGTYHVTGHPVFNGNFNDKPTRLMKLLGMALTDLLDNAGLDSAQIADTQFNLALPETERLQISGDEIRELIAHQSANPFSRCRIRLYPKGHAGMVFALADAVKAISHGICNRILVAGVDSLIGHTDLSRFDNQNRLKTFDQESGIVPGEAASAVLLEPLETAVARNANVRCVIKSVSTAREDNPLLSGKSSDGKGLSLAIKGLIDSRQSVHISASAVLSDMNGEPYREEEWNRIQPSMQQWIIGEKKLVCPSKSIGDTGAASPGVAICMASQAMERGYLSSNAGIRKGQAMILSSSDTGERGAVLLGCRFGYDDYPED